MFGEVHQAAASCRRLLVRWSNRQAHLQFAHFLSPIDRYRNSVAPVAIHLQMGVNLPDVREIVLAIKGCHYVALLNPGGSCPMAPDESHLNERAVRVDS